MSGSRQAGGSGESWRGFRGPRGGWSRPNGNGHGRLASARAEGISIRILATAIGLSSSRVHQLLAGADLDALDIALGERRAAGWPAPEDPDCGEDTELDGRDIIARPAIG
jgi:hypothetical protein